MCMVLADQMLDELAVFAMDNGQEASRCGQDWLCDREILVVLYTYQTCQEKVCIYNNREYQVRTRRV